MEWLVWDIMLILCSYKYRNILQTLLSSIKASLEGIMLALFPIIWVILAALFLYNTTIGTGAMENIKTMLAGLSPDRRIQALIIAFAFGGFLEAVAGFGTAVAIPAGIFISIISPRSKYTIYLKLIIYCL